jgi:signal transduction histidine kinase
MVDCITVGSIQPIRNLMGNTDRFDTYDDRGFSEAKFLTEYSDKPLHLAYFYHGKIRNAYLFDTEQAEAMAEQLPLVEVAIPGQCKIPEATFYAAMIWLRALRRSPERTDAISLLDKLAKVEERLHHWASLCPDNFEAKYLLVRAERARYRGAFAEATEFYRRATASARTAKYVNLEAVANELHGEFWLEYKQDRIAEVFLADAAHLYRSWGANGKLTQLQQRHGAMLATASQRLKPEMASGPLSAPLSDPRSIGSLDVASILDANHALSSEIGLGRVLTRLIKILRENSGAQTVRLMLQNDSGWCLEGNASGEESEVLQSQRVSVDDTTSAFFPLSLVRYVLRTGEEIVEENLSTSMAYGGDPYCRKTRPKSVMCLPIKRFSQVAGVIYLENNLTAGVFTRERSRFVRMLSVQAIISIDNARLYQSLEQKVEERTRELHAKNEVLVRTQKQLVAQEKLASLGVLTAGIAHELKNPLNFVNNFADLSVGLADDLKESMASSLANLDPDTAEEVNETLTLLRSNVEKIRDHGKRATQIIDGMLMHSRESRGTRVREDLRKLVNEAVNLTKEGMRNRPNRLDVVIEVENPERLESIEVVRSDIGRVLINVLGNALDALQQKKQSRGASFEPRITVRTIDRDDHVEIRIRDNGSGIPKNIIQDIWTPFFTTKPAGAGTGLGLSISHDIIVGAHRGTMHVESMEGEFAEFILTIPRHAPAQSPRG